MALADLFEDIDEAFDGGVGGVVRIGRRVLSVRGEGEEGGDEAEEREAHEGGWHGRDADGEVGNSVRWGEEKEGKGWGSAFCVRLWKWIHEFRDPWQTVRLPRRRDRGRAMAWSIMCIFG